MILNLVNTTLLVVGGLLLYRFWPRIWQALQRFDAENHARIRQERDDRRDSSAHIRHAINIAAEQVEAVATIEERDPRTATQRTLFVFEGERYATRDEAEAARAEKIGTIARGFYHDLPRALVERRGKEKLN